MQRIADPSKVSNRNQPDNRRIASDLGQPVWSEAHAAHLVGELKNRLANWKEDSEGATSELAHEIIEFISGESLTAYAEILSRACFHFFEVGRSTTGITIGKQIYARANLFGNIAVQRRIANIIGGQYCDVADFAAAMEYLEIALMLARRLADPLVEAACLSNVITVLQEMGHYRQAIEMANRVLRLADESENAKLLKLQCASNGLFAAHRVGDAAAAARFLDEGQRYISANVEPLRRAFFERGRALYLVDLGEAARAKAHVEDALATISGEQGQRIRTLLTIAHAVSAWGTGSKEKARMDLECLHRDSKKSRMYHNFVLQALVKVYSDASTPEQASAGLSHARELVEFTTSVKKAKFYRQLANRREENEHRLSSLLSSTTIDPFSSIKDWLSTSDVLPLAGEPGLGERRVVTKHEELTAIHEDMAKLRIRSLRREIRTDAVDTAENWAIAAEFFDDETGQHCYRVGHLASMLAREVGMDETFCVRVEHAARLHDIGKIAVNEVILLKPGPLDASEMAAMRLHTEVGAQILSGSDDPTLMMAVEVARHHHEWWNGGGYPMKLGGKDIPMSARVCAYADVYDALTHARAYKKAWSHERALEEITRLGGTQFDPALMQPFCNVLQRYREDLATAAIPAFADMDSNALIASRKSYWKRSGEVDASEKALGLRRLRAW